MENEKSSGKEYLDVNGKSFDFDWIARAFGEHVRDRCKQILEKRAEKNLRPISEGELVVAARHACWAEQQGDIGRNDMIGDIA